MKCLHICNDFLGSRVHRNLYDHLDILKLEQTIYYPVRSYTDEKNVLARQDTNIQILSSKPLKKYHRYFFRRKISYLFNDIKTKTNLLDYDIMHATTLFTDGALALKIHKTYNTPYIVAVRGTDLNLFLKYRIDLFPIAREVLYNAEKIIFISDSMEGKFFKHYYIKDLNKNIIKKSQLIYNGIDSIWLNKINVKKMSPKQILYIGRFDKNKNVLNLVNSVLNLRKYIPELQLTLVGKKGKEEERIKLIAKNNPDVINFIGPVYDKIRLKEIYAKNHIFAMPSFSETFGLVYIEALSQGLPVLYSEGQGIDGLFKEKVGEAVKPNSVINIERGLKDIIANYSEYELDKIDFSIFDWKTISETYLNIYNEILKK